MTKPQREIIDLGVEKDTFSLVKCHDGFWLYDYLHGMNLAIRAPTEQAAFVKALLYYQKRLRELQEKHSLLSQQVESFIDAVRPSENEDKS